MSDEDYNLIGDIMGTRQKAAGSYDKYLKNRDKVLVIPCSSSLCAGGQLYFPLIYFTYGTQHGLISVGDGGQIYGLAIKCSGNYRTLRLRSI